MQFSIFQWYWEKNQSHQFWPHMSNSTFLLAIRLLDGRVRLCLKYTFISEWFTCKVSFHWQLYRYMMIYLLWIEWLIHCALHLLSRNFTHYMNHSLPWHESFICSINFSFSLSRDLLAIDMNHSVNSDFAFSPLVKFISHESFSQFPWYTHIFCNIQYIFTYKSCRFI